MSQSTSSPHPHKQAASAPAIARPAMTLPTMVQPPINHYLPSASRLIVGCMGLGGGWNQQAVTADDIQLANKTIDTALENGLNYFDHADIYTFGKAEQVFGLALKDRPHLREHMFVQTKCGIRFEEGNTPKHYDLSGEWINHSVEKSLAQLHCDYIDCLLLHRPDPLMQLDDIAETYLKLKQEGKVKHLGVSNMQQHQIHALQFALGEPIIVNQIEVSLKQTHWVDEGIYAGHPAGQHINFTPGLLQYCEASHVQIQAWGALCQGLFTGNKTDQQPPHIQRTHALVLALAHSYNTSKEAIVLAWLMRHPNAIQPIIGTTNSDRIKACAQAIDINMSRDDWYALYVSAKNEELP